MIGGVTMNVILGIGIYTYILLHFNKEYIANKDVNDGIYTFELAQRAGLQNGDKIIAINGKPFERFEDVLSGRVILGSELTVERNGRLEKITIPGDFYREVSKAGKGFFLSTYRTTIKIDSVFPGAPASTAGLHKDDKILLVNGKRMASGDSLLKAIKASAGNMLQLTILRGNETLSLAPVVNDTGAIGIRHGIDFGNYTRTPYTFASALRMGTADAMQAIVTNAKGLKLIFTGKEKARDALQGPIGIATIYGAHWDWERFWIITGLLSMVLAFMNILPIPALDGGHVLFLLIETITGRRLSDKFMERAQIAGMVILISLMVFVIGNDIWKHILN